MLGKRISIFYIYLLVPIGTLIILAKFNVISNIIFLTLLGIYILIYQPLICGVRLLQSNKVRKADLWKNLIPFWNDKYWAYIFFNKE
jgi:hypothetical protein